MSAPVAAPGPYKLASVLLQYPTLALFDGLDQLRAAARACPRGSARPLLRFLDWLGSSTPGSVGRHYVDTFDLRGRCALYLTYHRYGDTRRRGMALLAFTSAYRVAGWRRSDAELPDYLPLVLDFAALAPRGQTLLREHRAELELLRRALQQAGTPYARVLDAVCARLGRLGAVDRVRIRRAWGQPPPREEVGVEPFAPPEYLSEGTVGP